MKYIRLLKKQNDKDAYIFYAYWFEVSQALSQGWYFYRKSDQRRYLKLAVPRREQKDRIRKINLLQIIRNHPVVKPIYQAVKIFSWPIIKLLGKSMKKTRHSVEWHFLKKEGIAQAKERQKEQECDEHRVLTLD